jgi:hypothetical protein
MGEYMQELRLATSDGLKGKDDCIDTISMLGYLKPWKPSDNVPGSSEDERWEEPAVKQVNPLSSYIV